MKCREKIYDFPSGLPLVLNQNIELKTRVVRLNPFIQNSGNESSVLSVEDLQVMLLSSPPSCRPLSSDYLLQLIIISIFSFENLIQKHTSLHISFVNIFFIIFLLSYILSEKYGKKISPSI